MTDCKINVSHKFIWKVTQVKSNLISAKIFGSYVLHALLFKSLHEIMHKLNYSSPCVLHATNR